MTNETQNTQPANKYPGYQAGYRDGREGKPINSGFAKDTFANRYYMTGYEAGYADRSYSRRTGKW